jgi:hypothetical protein
MSGFILSPWSCARLDPAPTPIPPNITALCGDIRLTHSLVLQSLFMRAARGERVALVVGNNRCDVYRLARLARAHRVDPAAVLSRVELSRPFTCYQLQHCLHTLANETHAPWRAVYVMGLLDSFGDEDIRVRDAQRLLQSALADLKTMAGDGLPVLISMAPPKQVERAHFVELVRRVAAAYWQPASIVLDQCNIRQLPFAEGF